MPRYKLLIEYAGTAYSGWQRQPNATTVEEKVEAALTRVLGQPVDVIGQGRTDSGVHAEGQAAHFDFPEELDAHRLLYALLGVLPGDIAVWDLQAVAHGFHARFDASFRQYRYQIARRPRPLVRDTSVLVLRDLDTEAMNDCASMVKGTHNFDSFTKPDNQNPNSECSVTRSEFEEKDQLLIYRIRANRFVRHLVRRLVGTMIEVGKGKRTAAAFEDMLRHPSKAKNGRGAPAKGLILERVGYE